MDWGIVDAGGGMQFQMEDQDQIEIAWAEKVVNENIPFEQIKQNIDQEVLNFIKDDTNNLIFSNQQMNGGFLQEQMKEIINFVQIPNQRGVYNFPEFYAGLFQSDYSYSSVLLGFEYYEHYLQQNFFGDIMDIKLSDGFRKDYDGAVLLFSQMLADLRVDEIADMQAASDQAQISFQLGNQVRPVYENVQNYSTHKIKQKIRALGFEQELQKDLTNIIISNEQGVQMQEIQANVESQQQQRLQIELAQRQNTIDQLESQLSQMGQQIELGNQRMNQQNQQNIDAQNELNKQIQLKTYQFESLQTQYEREKQNFDIQSKSLQNQMKAMEQKLQQNVEQLSVNLQKEKEGFSLEQIRVQQLQTQLKREIEERKELAQSSEAERTQLLEQNSKNQAQLNSKISELNGTIQKKQILIEQIRGDLAKEQQNVKLKMGEIDSINFQLQTIKGELDTQITLNNQQKQIQSDLKERIKAVEQQRFEVDQKEIESQKKLTMNSNELARKDAQIQKLQTEIQSQVDIYKNIEIARNELENKIKLNSQELVQMASLKQSMDKVQKEKEQLEIFIKEESEKVLDNTALKDRAEVQQQKILNLDRQLFEKDQEFQQLQQQMDFAQQGFQEQLSYKQEELSRMSIQITQIDQLQERKQQIITSLENQKLEIIKQNDILVQEIQDVNRELNQTKEQFRLDLKNKQDEILQLQKQLDLSKHVIPEQQVKMNSQLMEIIQLSIGKINNLEPEQIVPVQQQDNELQKLFQKYKLETENNRQKLLQQKKEVEEQNFILKQQLEESQNSKNLIEQRLEQKMEQYNIFLQRIQHLEKIEIDQRLRLKDMQQINKLLEQKERDPIVEPVQPQLQQIIIQQVLLPEIKPVEPQQNPVEPVQAQVEYDGIFIKIQGLIEEITGLKKLIPSMQKVIQESDQKIKSLQEQNIFLAEQWAEQEDSFNQMVKIFQTAESILQNETDPFEIVQKMFELFQINRNVQLKNPKQEFDELLKKYNALLDQFEFQKQQHASIIIQIQSHQQHTERKLENQQSLPQVGKAAELVDKVLIQYRQQNLQIITDQGLSSIFNQIMTKIQIPSEIDLGLKQNELQLLRSATADQLMTLFSIWDYDFFKQLFQSEFINQQKIKYMDFLISLSTRFQNKIEDLINRKKDQKALTLLKTSDTQTDEVILPKIQSGMAIEKDKKLEKERLFFQSGFGSDIIPKPEPQIAPEVIIQSRSQPLVIPKPKYVPKLEINLMGEVFSQDPTRTKKKTLGYHQTSSMQVEVASKPLPQMERKIYQLYKFQFEMKPIPQQKPKIKTNLFSSMIAIPEPRPELKSVAIQTTHSNFLGLQEQPREEVRPIVVPKPFATQYESTGFQTIPQPEIMIEEKQGTEIETQTDQKQGQEIETQTDFYDPQPMEQEEAQPRVQDKFYNPRENRNPQPPPDYGDQQRPQPVQQEFTIDEAIDVEPTITKQKGKEMVQRIVQNQIEKIIYQKPRYTTEPIDDDGDEGGGGGEDEDFFRPSTYTDQTYSHDSLYDLYYLLLRVRQILNKQVAAGDRRKDDKRLQSVNVSIKIVKQNIDYQKMLKQNKAQYF